MEPPLKSMLRFGPLLMISEMIPTRMKVLERNPAILDLLIKSILVSLIIRILYAQTSKVFLGCNGVKNGSCHKYSCKHTN